jgi:hypothetical protein
VTGAVKTDTANSKENTVKEQMGMTLSIRVAHFEPTTEGKEDIFSYDRNSFFS